MVGTLALGRCHGCLSWMLRRDWCRLRSMGLEVWDPMNGGWNNWLGFGWWFC
ncbi:hypothetical protein [Candidatus Hodgkinia cicadicola]|uniref:hypothetical protein n=1 Tax=Candidatus Hodgkinia cicadicola TaxID=573658 RepID=UPI001788D531